MFTAEIIMEALVDLVSERESIFSPENLRFKGGGGEHYFTERVIRGVEEVYYLFGKIDKKDQLIIEIIDTLEDARTSSTPEVIKSLNDKLELFLKTKENYLISL